MVATEGGIALLEHARSILGHLERASDELAHIAPRQGGTVRVGVTPWLMQSVMPRVITAFRELRPAVQLDIFDSHGKEYPMVRNGQVDFEFGPRPQDLSATALRSDRSIATRLPSCVAPIIQALEHALWCSCAATTGC